MLTPHKLVCEKFEITGTQKEALSGNTSGIAQRTVFLGNLDNFQMLVTHVIRMTGSFRNAL